MLVFPRFSVSQVLSSVMLSLLTAGYLLWRKTIAGGIATGTIVASASVVFVILLLAGGCAKEDKVWSPKPSFDWSMHYFRAFAIVCIVLTHYTGCFGYSHLKQLIFRSSTVYFLLISGYLCQYLDLKKKTHPLTYYRNKLQNVIAPYLVWTVVFIVLAQIDPVTHSGMRGDLKGVSFFKCIEHFVSGSTSSHLWYIPFVSVLFLVSPLVLRLSNASLILVTFIAGFFYFLFPSRTGISKNLLVTFGLYCHFTVFYLLGFVYARYKASIDVYLRRYWVLIAICGFFCALRIGFRGDFPVELMPFDEAITLEKLFFSGLIILCLDCLRNKRILILDIVARYSFALYFIHYYFISDVLIVRNSAVSWFAFSAPVTFVFDMFIAGVYILTLLGVAVLFKKSLRSNSRLFTGA